MNILSKASIGLIVATSLIGCGKGKVDNAVEGAKNVVKEHKMMGTWESKCKESKILGSSMKEFYKFSGNSFIKTSEFAATKDCTEPSARMQYEGTFKVADKSDKVDDARNIDMEYKTAILLPFTKTGVDLLNAIHFCGVTDWQVGKKHDLTVPSVATLCPVSNMPMKRYDIVTVEDKKLLLGVGENDGLTTVDKRPLEFDRDEPFIESKHELKAD